MASTLVLASRRVPRYLAWDALFVGLSVGHGALLLIYPSIATIALGLWWNANTIAHNFIHRPFFRSAPGRRAYSAYLSLLLGFPQSLWRRRHLLHHAGLGRPLRLTPEIAFELALVAGLWTALAIGSSTFFLTTYLPGWAIGLTLCQLHGHYEHARGTTSHYGRIYNWLFFNDGFHVEHHLRPTAHWTELSTITNGTEPASRWPAVFRWLEIFSLEGLERLVLKSHRLQRLVLAAHERAVRRLLPAAGPVDRVTIVGGGLFPRTALVMKRVLPGAAITIVDVNADHLAVARRFLDDAVRSEHRAYRDGESDPADLVVIPLSFRGDRRAIYSRPPARAVLVHDWIWRPAPASAVVSWWLLKRINLVLQ
jgi:hypothetical protein